MSKRDDGGPAFPSGHGELGLEGMSLRDWFAGQALAGIMAQSHGGPKDWTHAGWGWGEDCLNSLNKHETSTAVTVASFAYQIADAMLAARKKDQPHE